MLDECFKEDLNENASYNEDVGSFWRNVNLFSSLHSEKDFSDDELLKFIGFVRKNAFKYNIFPNLPEIELKITTRDSWLFDGLALGDETIIGRLGCYCPQYVVVKDKRGKPALKFKHGSGYIMISNYGKETSYRIACLVLHEMLHQLIAETQTTTWMQ